MPEGWNWGVRGSPGFAVVPHGFMWLEEKGRGDPVGIA